VESNPTCAVPRRAEVVGRTDDEIVGVSHEVTPEGQGLKDAPLLKSPHERGEVLVEVRFKQHPATRTRTEPREDEDNHLRERL